MLSLNESVPISKLMENEIQYLKDWAKHRARSASMLPINVELKFDEEDL
jgi:hypothetical protein